MFHFKRKANVILAMSVLGMSLMMGGCIQRVSTGSEAGKKAADYINTNFLKSQKGMESMEAKFKAAEPKGDFYNVTLDIMQNGQSKNTFNVFVTKSGKSILLNPDQMYIYDMSLSPAEAAKKAQVESAKMAMKNIKKADRPDIKIFVMSGCPYGVQIEEALEPVLSKIGKDINLDLHYIVSKGSGAECFSGYCSMHGMMEAKEDARQACIQQTSPNKFWAYLKAFNTNCSVSDSNTDKCSVTSMTKAGIDQNTINACMKGASNVLMQEAKIADSFRATGSPTIIINGANYEGGRTPNELLQSFCSAFKNKPTGCDGKIEGAVASQPAPKGGCGK